MLRCLTLPCECVRTDSANSVAQVWRRVSKEVLQPSHPFKLHQLLLNAVYQGWDAQTQVAALPRTSCRSLKPYKILRGASFAMKGPIPVWIPTPEGIRDTNLANFMASFQVGCFESSALQCGNALPLYVHSTKALILIQGSKEWSQKLVGDPVHDYPLLQRISCTEPEVFWPQVFAHMRIQYEQQPQRCAPACLAQLARYANCAVAHSSCKTRQMLFTCALQGISASSRS